MARKIRRDNIRSRLLHRLTDIAINWMAVVLAYVAKERFNLGIPTNPLDTQAVLHTLVAVAGLWTVSASLLETYAYKRRLFSEIVNLLAVLVLTIAFLNTYAYFTRLFVYPRYAMVLYAGLAAVSLTLSRSIKHSLQHSLHRRGFNVRKAIIIGTGPIAKRLGAALRENHSLGYQFLGFVGESSDQAMTRNCLGSLDDLETIVSDSGAEEAIIALPGYEHQTVLDIAHRCQAREMRLRVVPDLFEIIMVRATLSEIEDIPLIGLRDPVITGYQGLVKRCFDIAVASFCLLLASPLFLIIPLAIWLDSRGKIFFRQTRVGENGRPFAMYKFRSMVSDAEQRLAELVKIEELDQPVFKIQNDPRVTRVGRFLRRSSLDELPQLLNVLKGDMSMVGPRPEELQVVEHYQLWHRKRLSIKPGITGPMQVAGRGELPLDERIRLELLYISRYSILEDVKYLLKTIPAVCRARGAY